MLRLFHPTRPTSTITSTSTLHHHEISEHLLKDDTSVSTISSEDQDRNFAALESGSSSPSEKHRRESSWDSWTAAFWPMSHIRRRQLQDDDDTQDTTGLLSGGPAQQSRFYQGESFNWPKGKALRFATLFGVTGLMML
jgi:hypothetical protein